MNNIIHTVIFINNRWCFLKIIVFSKIKIFVTNFAVYLFYIVSFTKFFSNVATLMAIFYVGLHLFPFTCLKLNLNISDISTSLHIRNLIIKVS